MLSLDAVCKNCAADRQRKKDKARASDPVRYQRKRELYNNAYRKAAKELKATATHCHICKQPFVEGDRVEADHLIPGSNEGGLAAAHRLCNQRRGNRPL